MSDARNRSNADGAGALLGLAAGDQLAAMQSPDEHAPHSYGYRTQQATVVAYHLMRWGGIRKDSLRSELVSMAFSEEGPPAYRGEPAWLTGLLGAARSGVPPAAPPGDGAAPLALAVGLWYRWAAEQLVSEAVEAASVTHVDGASLVAAAAYAAAVAAATFGQHGLDFLNAVGEASKATLELLGRRDVSDPEAAASLVASLRAAAQWLGARPSEVVEATAAVGPGGSVVAAAVLGSVPWDQSEDAVRSVAVQVQVAPLVGGIVVARRGIAHWPWDMPNELWFAEIGRRLVTRSRTYEDLPDPYAVEAAMRDPTWAPHRIF